MFFQARRDQLQESAEDLVAWRSSFTPQTWKSEVCVYVCVCVSADCACLNTFSDLCTTCTGLPDPLPPRVHSSKRTQRPFSSLHLCQAHHVSAILSSALLQPVACTSYFMRAQSSQTPQTCVINTHYFNV